jgi:hypothetical protein
VEAHQSGYLNFFLDAYSFNKAILLEWICIKKKIEVTALVSLHFIYLLA